MVINVKKLILSAGLVAVLSVLMIVIVLSMAVQPHPIVVASQTTKGAVKTKQTLDPTLYWSKTYGGAGRDVINDVKVLPDGDIIAVGYTNSSGAGGYDALVMKLTPNGSVIWAKTYGGPKNDEANAVVLTKGGDVIVVGWINGSNTNKEVWVFKLNPNGSVIWQKIYGKGEATAVALTPDGGIVLAGYTTVNPLEVTAWILKLSQNGNLIWRRAYDNRRALAVAVAPNGDIIAVGSINTGLEVVGASTNTRFWVIRLSENGKVAWQKSYEGVGTCAARAVAVAPNGDIVVTGWTLGYGPGPAGGKENIWVFRLRGDGSVIWQRVYGTPEADNSTAVAVAPDGDIILVGWTKGVSMYITDAWILRLEGNGSIIWQRAYGGLGNNRANTVALAPSGAIIVAGCSKGFTITTDAWIFKLPPNGTVKTPYSMATNVKPITAYGVVTYNLSMVVEKSNASVHIWNSTVKPLFAASNGEYWAREYEGDGNVVIDDLRILPDGDIIAAGSTDSSGAGGYDALVMKLTPNGILIWAKTYGSSGNDTGRSIALTPDGDIIVVGTTDSFGAGGYDVWVLKLDPDGNVIWQKTYGGLENDVASSVVVTPRGDIIIGGSTRSFGEGGAVWVLKLNPDGNVIWQKTYGGISLDETEAVTLAPDGDILVAGLTLNPNTGIDALVVRLNENGSVVWQKAYGGNKTDIANSIAVAPNGNIFVVGWTDSFGAGDYDVWVLKLSPNSSIIWQKTYGGNDWDVGSDIALTSNGSILIAGGTRSFGFLRFNGWIMKLNPNSEVEWQRAYGSKDVILSIADAITVDSYGNVFVAGASESIYSDRLIAWLLKLPPDGNASYLEKTNATPVNSKCAVTNVTTIKITWSDASVHVWNPGVRVQFCTLHGNYWMKTYGGLGEDVIRAVKVLPDGDIVAVGYTNSSGAGGYDALVMKLTPNGSLIWAKTYGGPKNDEANAIALTPGGDIVVAGWTESFGARDKDVWIFEISPNGSVVWQRIYGGPKIDEANSVAVAKNGDIVVAGYTDSFGAGRYDVWVLKLDPDGNVIWQKTYGGKKNDMALTVALTPGGDIVVAGWTESFGAGGYDAWVIKLNPEGDIIWAKTYGGFSMDIILSSALTAKGDIVLVGVTGSFGHKGNNRNKPSRAALNVWVLKLDPNGSVIWQKTYVRNSWAIARAVALSTKENIIVVSKVENLINGRTNTWVIKLNPEGDIIWQEDYNESRSSGPLSVALTQWNGIVISGWIYSLKSAENKRDVWVLEIPSWGGYGSKTNIAVDVSNCSVINTTSVKMIESNATTRESNAVIYQFLKAPPVSSTTTTSTTSTTSTSMFSTSTTSTGVNNSNSTTTTKTSTSVTSTVTTTITSTSPTSSTISSTSATITVSSTTRTNTSTSSSTNSTKVNSTIGTSTSSTLSSSKSMRSSPSSTSHPTRRSTNRSSKKKGICGPAAIVALALIPLLLKRKRR